MCYVDHETFVNESGQLTSRIVWRLCFRSQNHQLCDMPRERNFDYTGTRPNSAALSDSGIPLGPNVPTLSPSAAMAGTTLHAGPSTKRWSGSMGSVDTASSSSSTTGTQASSGSAFKMVPGTSYGYRRGKDGKKTYYQVSRRGKGKGKGKEKEKGKSKDEGDKKAVPKAGSSHRDSDDEYEDEDIVIMTPMMGPSMRRRPTLSTPRPDPSALYARSPLSATFPRVPPSPGTSPYQAAPGVRNRTTTTEPPMLHQQGIQESTISPRLAPSYPPSSHSRRPSSSHSSRPPSAHGLRPSSSQANRPTLSRGYSTNARPGSSSMSPSSVSPSPSIAAKAEPSHARTQSSSTTSSAKAPSVNPSTNSPSSSPPIEESRSSPPARPSSSSPPTIKPAKAATPSEKARLQKTLDEQIAFLESLEEQAAKHAADLTEANAAHSERKIRENVRVQRVERDMAQELDFSRLQRLRAQNEEDHQQATDELDDLKSLVQDLKDMIHENKQRQALAGQEIDALETRLGKVKISEGTNVAESETEGEGTPVYESSRRRGTRGGRSAFHK